MCTMEGGGGGGGGRRQLCQTISFNINHKFSISFVWRVCGVDLGSKGGNYRNLRNDLCPFSS